MRLDTAFITTAFLLTAQADGTQECTQMYPCVGYYQQGFNCHKCDGVRWAEFSGFLVFLLVLLVFLSWLGQRYWRLVQLSMEKAMSHVKIIISFVVVLLSVDAQFGIAWPPVFSRMLDALVVFTFDFGVLGGFFCLANFGAQLSIHSFISL
eukprot:g1613.t1